MHPHATTLMSVEAATAALYVHYASIRDKCVSMPIHSAFWGKNTIFLWALAMYLREPIYVWVVDRAGTAHVQQYSFAER